MEIAVTDGLDADSVRRNLRLIEKMIAMRPAELIIDLTRCGTVDQAGVALLTDLHRTLRDGGGQLTLRGLSMQVYQVLRSERLEEVLQSADRPSGYRPRHRSARQRSRQMASDQQSEDLRWWRAPTTEAVL
ncbi:STAS domain-containing protein [Dactylosporangium aurantiacum]|uniref:STAS domain-containing protein n=1 Tax=Dactylosporangium aurantiacum TaxID=35754 RepID=A0A9Q9MMW4_9ACTN|nr:STAS domain-containing protein [Dactylosporangium aurantiacum]MDG6110389.1 STAS domain-containing protein [Dactylosporangium aurantiacum]UWZ58601.1 STAS domain-containing protein [Dactylosporangium aurantiacum]